MSNFFTNLFTTLFCPLIIRENPILEVEVLPQLDQSLFPILRSETEAGRLISNAQKNYENSCQVVYAAMTDYARKYKSWCPVLYSDLDDKIIREILPPYGSKIEPIDIALNKKIITIISFEETWYVIPNHKKFKKYLDNNFIPTLNT